MEEAQTYLLEFSRNSISKDLLNDEFWKERVEPVFANHGLTCTMNEDECTMILVADHTEDKDIIERATLALYVLASGLTAEWVEPILLGKIYCEMIVIEKPDEMSVNEFSSKYDEFINKFEDEYELHYKWCCFVIYFEKSMTVLANSSQATSAVKSLVRESLFGGIPFHEKVDMLTSEIVTYDKKQQILTNNLWLFSSLLDRVSV